MATEQPGGPDAPALPDQDQYEAQTADTTWIHLDDGDGAIQVQEVTPLKLMRDMRRYGVMALMQDDGDSDDIAAAVEDGSFDRFVQDVILQNIVKPACYWSGPSDLLARLSDSRADTLREQHDFDGMDDDRAVSILRQHLDVQPFDLAVLTEDDLVKVIAGMTGQNPDDLDASGGDDPGDTFQG